MNQYTRLTEKERYLIEYGIRSRRSMRAIARSIDRPAKTVSEEIKRNGGLIGYYANEAHYNRNKSNRSGHSKINENIDLKNYIYEKLDQGWPPEVIAGRWNLELESRDEAALPAAEANFTKISHESIYAWIYEQDGALYLKLPRKKKKRGLKPQRNKSKIPNRTSIHVRPENINDRSEVGHYESDLVFQQGNKSQNILSVVERKSRMIILKKNESKHSAVVIGALKDIKLVSKKPILSLTFDNGSEFANHSELSINTYFCDPGSPWQKGSIENVNGIVRRYIDYRMDVNLITQDMLDSVAHVINNKPRKLLNFLTPNEQFEKFYRKNSEGVTF